MRKQKYNLEKVLYLSGLPKGLNVSVSEPSHTDLSARVKFAVERNYIKLLGSDDADFYYKITEAGSIRLLEMQIVTRKELGKSTDLHEETLIELKKKQAEAQA